MDIVIPYKNCPSDGLELRYTLRGIEKYFPDLENVFIIGDHPRFLQNVIHIPATDSRDRKHKALNIKNKLLLACSDKRVSDSFAMFNDEHFLLKPWQPVYDHCGSLEDSLRRYNAHQSYRNTLSNTYNQLNNSGLNFDTHSPIVFQKDIFLRTVTTVNWSRPWGYGIKSLYCNMAGITGEKRTDLKIKQSWSKENINGLLLNHSYFSIDDRALNNHMIKVLQELYPKKSIYESD
jgi:hypothetical protein